MKRTEAHQQFKETEVKLKSTEKLFALEEYFQQHKDDLVPGFVESFRQLCLKIKDMQSKNEKAKIGYINYSMLRTEMIENNYTYLIEAFNEEWFLDFKECHGSYDASWAFKFLDEFEIELQEKRKQYIGAIAASDVKRMKLKEAIKFNEYIISLARYAMPKAVELKEYLDIAKDEEVEIRVGEYRDMSEIVYKEDTREKDSKKIKEWLEEKLEDEYTYEVFRNLDLCAGDFNDIDLSYVDFKGSRLSNSNMKRCILVGSKFDKALMEGVDFSGSLIHSADFSQCNLNRANFCETEGACGNVYASNWEMPGFTSVSFENAKLDDANFEGADLKGAIFTGASLQGANFKGANLQNAVFLKKDEGLANLDEAQRKTIRWIP